MDGPVLNEHSKRGFAPENEIQIWQICSGQLDTFDPYWNARQGNNIFFITIAFPLNQR